MRIDVAAYINQLLYEHDCIIIPGFGGFITNYQPAMIDYAQGFLHPPTKSITFNQNLTLNDGLLINYIARKEFISYEEARTSVEEYAQECKQKLNRKEILPIPKVGKLYNDMEHKLQFLPDSTNFRTESYGLPKLQYYPILRSKQAAVPVKPVEKVIQRPVATVKQLPAKKVAKPFEAKRFAPIAAAATILGLIGMLSFILVKLDYSDNLMATKGPDTIANMSIDTDQSGFISTPLPLDTKVFDQKKAIEEEPEEASPVDQMSEKELDTLLEKAVKEEEDAELEKVKNMTKDEFKLKAENIEKTLNKKGHVTYTIIVGAFGNKKNANNLTTRINGEGYETEIAKQGNLYRVGLLVSCMPKELEDKLRSIRKKYKKDAWVLKE